MRFVNPLTKAMRLGVFSSTSRNHLIKYDTMVYFSNEQKAEYREFTQPLARPLSEKRQHMDKSHCWSTSILGPLLFSIYINDLSEGLSTNAKLLAGNATLFSVIHDSQTSANDLNKDLEMIHNWAFQWKVNFNVDPTKQAQEVIFSCKTKKTSSCSPSFS